MEVASHKMSLMAIMAAAAQPAGQTSQQGRLASKKPASAHAKQFGSISPKLTTAKIKVAVKSKRVVGPKKPRKSRVVYNFTAETLSQYFHLSQRDASKLLGVAPITMKRNCKRQGILWPYRAQKIEAAHRARQGSESASSEVGEEDDRDASDDDDDATTETQVAQALMSMSPPTAPMSEAGLVFARLPYLCLEEDEKELHDPQAAWCKTNN